MLFIIVPVILLLCRLLRDTVTGKMRPDLSRSTVNPNPILKQFETMVTLPKSTSDVSELLSSAHKNEKEEARAILKIIVSSICFLARQGLALRGHDEANSNFVQLLPTQS